MKTVFSLIILVFLAGCKAQNDMLIPDNWKKENPDFANQGEQEDYNAYKFFKENYKIQEFEKYKGVIKDMKDSISYNNKIINVNGNDDVKSIFTKGILYPEILCNDTLLGGIRMVTNILELKSLNPSGNSRRFSLWLYRKRMINPSVYLFELTNKNAKAETNMKEFIGGAKLTFLQRGWVIL